MPITEAGDAEETVVMSRPLAWEIEHGYGPRVHILDNLYLQSALARLSSPRTRLPQVVSILRTVYETLLIIASRELPSVRSEIPTRMAVQHPAEGVYRGPTFDPTVNVVVVDIVRAGIIPSQVCFDRLLSALPEERVRLDHLNMSRLTDDDGNMTGVDISGSKIGGPVEGSVLLLPDPMGATGAFRCVERRHRAWLDTPSRTGCGDRPRRGRRVDTSATEVRRRGGGG